MSYKVFSNGNVLNASELNEFLMNQSVIAFSNATARSSAITSPVEGMITYLEDSNSYQSWDGSAWVGVVPQSGNAIINGAFEINQRNFTTTTTSALYLFDRWSSISAGGTSTWSAESFTPGEAPFAGYEGSSFIRIVSSGQSGTPDSTRLQQPIENVRTFAGQTITLSFFARAASGTPSVAANLRQIFGTGGSAAVEVGGKKVQLTTNWARYSMTFEVPSLTGKTIGSGNRLTTSFYTSAGSDLNASTDSLGLQATTIDLWGVQLEAGPVATPFRRNANSLQGELAACQRYYVRYSVESTGASISPIGGAVSAAIGESVFSVPSTLRSTPTSLDISNLAWYSFGNGVVYSGGTITYQGGALGTPKVRYTHGSNVLTSGQTGQFVSSSGVGFIGFVAEL